MPKKRLTLMSAAAICFVLLGMMADFPARAADSLDRQALKAAVAGRVENLIKLQAPENAEKFSVVGEQVTLKKIEPVSLSVEDQEISLFAVKAALNLPDIGRAKDLTMVVDKSGRLQFSVKEIDSGNSLFQAAMDKIKKREIDPSLGKTVYSGDGAHELLMVSSPFCPYCRKTFSFFAEHKDFLGQWRLMDTAYKGQPATNAAVWSLMDGRDVVDPLELAKFAYTDLKPAGKGNPEQRSEKIIAQFIRKFPELKDKWGSAEQARYYLKGKYGEQALSVTKRARNELRVQATPHVFIDGVPVTGWNPDRYSDLLNIKKQQEEARYGQKQK